MAKTMDEIELEYSRLYYEVAVKMRELIETKGKKCKNNTYKKYVYVPTKKQQKNLAIYSDRSVKSVGISDKVSGDIYVESDNGCITAFSCVPFQIQFNILSCLTNNIK